MYMKKSIIIGKFIVLIYISIMAFVSVSVTPVYAKDKKFNMSYIYFGNSDAYKNHVKNTNHSLQAISPNYFDLDTDGTLKLTSALNTHFINEMHQQGIKVIPFLSNHWNRELGRLALQKRESLAQEIADAIYNYKLDGINIDIENMTEEDRDHYTDFVKQIRERLSSDKSISVAVAANPRRFKTGWQASYDHRSLAKYSDYLVVMAYDESYKGSLPGAIASLPFVEDSIKQVLEYVPNEKVVLGIPFYGRYWKEGESCGGYGLSLKKINALIQEYQGQVLFDMVKQSPKALIKIDENQNSTNVSKELTPGTYTIWYENEPSLKSKLRLVQKYNLKGTASWSLGQETQDTWDYYNRWLNGKYFLDTEGHWAQESILKAEEKGWMIGINHNQFYPEQSITRAQATTALVRLLALPENKEKVFLKDVKEHHWAKKYIDIAVQNGILVGDEKGNFKPDDQITREEMAVILCRIMPQMETLNHQSNLFKDVTQKNWAYDSIAQISKITIFVGYPDGNFRPKEQITRAQMAVLLDRVSLLFDQNNAW